MNKLFSFFAFLIICFSCISDYSTITNFVIENNTNKHVVLKISRFTDEFYFVKDTAFEIKPHFSIQHMYIEDGKDAISRYPFGIDSDSVKIIFNISHELLFTWNGPDPRNILNIDNYDGGKKNNSDGGVYEYTYTITEEDFNNAVPIKE